MHVDDPAESIDPAIPEHPGIYLRDILIVYYSFIIAAHHRHYHVRMVFFKVSFYLA